MTSFLSKTLCEKLLHMLKSVRRRMKIGLPYRFGRLKSEIPTYVCLLLGPFENTSYLLSSTKRPKSLLNPLYNQTLGCGAHVRIIAPPHVRCACESACEKHSEMCVRYACVRLVFGRTMCNSTFPHFFEQNDKISYFKTAFSNFSCMFINPNNFFQFEF